MQSAAATAAFLADIQLKTGFPDLDGVIEAVCQLCADEIGALLAGRNGALGRWASARLLEDPALELLSAVDIDLDRKLRSGA